MLVDKTVSELLEAFSSPAPTPGGGSAAALASSVGASLLVMVAQLPKTRTNSDAERTALRTAAQALIDLQGQLAAAIDADADAYDGVVAAYKQPKATDEQKQARAAAIQQALRRATEVPLTVMRLSADALSHSDAVAAHGLQSAAS